MKMRRRWRCGEDVAKKRRLLVWFIGPPLALLLGVWKLSSSIPPKRSTTIKMTLIHSLSLSLETFEAENIFFHKWHRLFLTPFRWATDTRASFLIFDHLVSRTFIHSYTFVSHYTNPLLWMLASRARGVLLVKLLDRFSPHFLFSIWARYEYFNIFHNFSSMYLNVSNIHARPRLAWSKLRFLVIVTPAIANIFVRFAFLWKWFLSLEIVNFKSCRRTISFERVFSQSVFRFDYLSILA